MNNKLPFMQHIRAIGLSCFIFLLCFFFAETSEGAIQRLGAIEGFALPQRVAVGSTGTIYVTDYSLNSLLIFNRNCSFKARIDGLSGPLGVAVDGAGRIYIGNGNNSGATRGAIASASVDVYSSAGQYAFSLGRGKGEFKKPNSIAVHSSGSIYVVDSDANMVKVYNTDGTIQRTFGVWGSQSGSRSGEFNFPAGIAIDEANSEIYVTDLAIFIDPTNGSTLGARVQVFDLTGGYIRSFGTFGTGDGMLNRPLGIAYHNDRVYVSDSLQCVAQVFDRDGNYIETVYDLARPMGTPVGIAAGGDGRILIASSGTGTVEIYGTSAYTNLTVSPLALSFRTNEGLNPATQDITLGNTGTGTLDWSMTADRNWITVAQTTGSIGSNGTAPVAAGINAAGLAQGTHSGNITITSAGASETVTVSLEVLPPPVLEVSPATLTFRAQAGGTQPASQSASIAVTNDVTGSATWEATSNAPWLAISPSQGTSAAATAAAVTVNTAGLGSGTYTGALTISSSGAAADIAVTLELIAAGSITVTTNLAEASFSITGPASYSGSGQSWSTTDAPAGDYRITFNKVAGYSTPAAQTFTVTSGKETVISGTYSEQAKTKKVVAGLGSGLANPAEVKVLNTDGTSAGAAFTAFTQKYGANVAAGDIDGDGLDEIIVGAGAYAGNAARVKIFETDGTEIPGLDFIAFASSKYGANVAAGDLDGDGIAEIIVGTGSGKGNTAIVRVFRAENGAIADTGINFITDTAGGGVPVAAGDLDGDGIAEIITGAGYPQILSRGRYTNAPAIVRTWAVDDSGGPGSWTVTALGTFQPYAGGTGVKVAAADIDGDGADEVLAVEGLQKGQRIRAYNGSGAFKGLEFKEGGLSGILSIAAGDTDGDGQAEIVLGGAPAGTTLTSRGTAVAAAADSPTVKVYSGAGTLMQGFTAFTQAGGVNVALGKVE